MDEEDGSEPLANSSSEKFAQNLATGMADTDAWEAAGYRRNRNPPHRALKRPDIKARVAWLKAQGASAAVVTAQTIALQLDDDRKLAHKVEQPGAAVSASMGKAKLFGLISDRHEHTGKDGGPIKVDDVSITEAARRIAFALAKAAED